MLMAMSNRLFQQSRGFNSKIHVQIWPVYKLIWDFIHVHLICKFQEHPIKTAGVFGEDKHFLIVSLWDILVTIATKVFIGFPCKAYVMDFPSEACFWCEMTEISLQTMEIQLVKDVDGRRTTDGLPSYKLPLSLRPRWDKNYYLPFNHEMLDNQLHWFLIYIPALLFENNKSYLFFFFFLIWVLRPFQEYYICTEPIVHQRWGKTGEPGKKNTWTSGSRTWLSTCENLIL